MGLLGVHDVAAVSGKSAALDQVIDDAGEKFSSVLARARHEAKVGCLEEPRDQSLLWSALPFQQLEFDEHLEGVPAVAIRVLLELSQAPTRTREGIGEVGEGATVPWDHPTG